MRQPLQFAVIGLGRFGARVAAGLYEQGHDVVAIDKEQQAVDQIRDQVTTAICGDTTHRATLEAAGISEMDTVVVAIGDDVEASILTTALVKQMGCRHVVARASTDLHAEILKLVGAHEVVYPEHDVAIRLTRKLASPLIDAYVPLEGDLEFVHISVPESFIGHSLSELQVRRKHKVTVVAVHTTDENGQPTIILPSASYVFKKGDTAWVVGHEADLRRFEQIQT